MHSTGSGLHGALGRGGLASTGEELDFQEVRKTIGWVRGGWLVGDFWDWERKQVTSGIRVSKGNKDLGDS